MGYIFMNGDQDWFRRMLITSPISIRNVKELRRSVKRLSDRVFESFYTNFFIARMLINWNKMQYIVNSGIEIFINELGEEVVKEWIVKQRLRNLSDEERIKEVHKVIIDVFGSLDNYAEYGKKMKRICKDNLTPLLTKEELYYFEKKFISQVLKILVNDFIQTGQYIVNAVETRKKTLG